MKKSGWGRSLLLVAALLAVLIMPAGSRAATGSGDSSDSSTPPIIAAGPLGDAFSQAATQYGLPVDLLLAIGYYESHLEQQGNPAVDGTDVEDGGYGVMHLVERSDNNSLAAAAALIGQSPDALKSDATLNIKGAAALMQSLISQQNTNVSADGPIENWRGVVSAYSDAIHPGVAALYVQDIYTLLKQGFRTTTSSGEVLAVAPHDINMDNIPQVTTVQPFSDDYPPAHWVPAYSGNYTAANRPYDQNIDRIVIHDTESSYAAAISWFQNPSSQVSANYVIRSADGDITQMVHNHDIAWHAGNWTYNQHAIGIEHEGHINDPSWYTEQMYQASAALVRNLTDRYGIPRDRLHIISHKEVPNQAPPAHTDPGPYWDFTHYMALVRGDSNADTVVDNLDDSFHPVPTTVDQAHNWYTAAGSTYGTDAYSTYSVADQSQSTNYAVWRPNIPTEGAYDIYAFIPYVNNGNTDTSHAVYTVGFSGNNTAQVVINQDAYTDGLASYGEEDSMQGQWAAIGRYYLDAGTTNYVKLSDVTGETNKNVWFDAMRFIPVGSGQPPATATPTDTPVVQPTDTPTPPPTDTPVPAPTFTPGACGMNFPDLPDTYWAYPYISNLFCQGVMSGYNDGLFHPQDTMNRAQFAKLVTLSMGWSLITPAQQTFSDVSPSHWAYAFIETVAAHGAITGFADGTFHPGYTVTRAQVAIIIVRARNWPRTTPTNGPTFTDVPASYWAYTPIETAVHLGVINGYGNGLFGPDDTSTRDQLAKIIYNSMNVSP